MFLSLFLLAGQLWLAATPVLVKDLRSEWMEFTGQGYRLISDNPLDEIQTVYMTIDPIGFKGHRLVIYCPERWQLFVNGNLIYSGPEEKEFDIDSLAIECGGKLFLGVNAITGARDVVTHIVSTMDDRLLDAQLSPVRPPTFFRDYGIIVSVFLVLFILLLYRTNPQLTIDYFSFAKIFSVLERNENQLASRITSSVNLLFYLFCALLTGFLLSAIFYSSGPFFQASRPLQITSLGSAFGVWIKLSLFILILLASKLTIVFLFSTLFNFRETMSFQFFNFLRFVLFTGIFMAFLCLVYFAFEVGAPIFYEGLIVLGLFLLSAGSVVVLVKLSGRARFSFFHLFSYLCVSEIIPLVIIIKIFY